MDGGVDTLDEVVSMHARLLGSCRRSVTARQSADDSGLSSRSLLVILVLMAGWIHGCSWEPGPRSSFAPLDVQVHFPAFSDRSNQVAGETLVGEATSSTRQQIGGSMSETLRLITARAVEVGNEGFVREVTDELSPSDTRFRLELRVPPAAYYRIEVQASGIRETNGSNAIGILYSGHGFAMDVEAGNPQTVEIQLVDAVPALAVDVQRNQVLVSWNAIPGAIGYRLLETIGITDHEFDVAGLDTTFVFDPSQELRSYRVRAVLGEGRASAYSEVRDTGGPRGQLEVTVVDAANGGPIAGATAQVAQRAINTDGVGIARFSDLPPGTFPLYVSADGYLTSSTDVAIVSGQTTQVRVVLTAPLTSGYRIVLTWRELPSDLDSHLLTPSIEDVAYHVYYLAPGSDTEPPYARLDLDDTAGFGPETTTIFQNAPGTYRFYVFNFSGQLGDLPLAGSGAQVSLYRERDLLRTFTAPETGTGLYWNVFTLDAIKGSFEIINEISEEPFPGAPLAVASKAR